MRARAAVAALALLTLSACASVERPIAVREVDVPTPVACRPALGPDPVYPDSDAALRAAPDLFERVKRLLVGRLLRMAREAELEAALKGCAG